MESDEQRSPESTPDVIEPLTDGDSTTGAEDDEDAAQREWERTNALADGVPEDELEPSTATRRDPDEVPDADDEVPAEDLPSSRQQPETQSDDPVIADLGEDGEGDLAPEDV